MRRHSHHLGYVKPTPGSDPNLWESIDKQDTSGWTPEILQAKIDAAKDFDDLDHLLFSLQYARDVTYNHDGAEARDGRMRVTGLMDAVLAKRMEWLRNQNALAASAKAQLGWIDNAALVPAANYTGASTDPTKYAQAIVNQYGALKAEDIGINAAMRAKAQAAAAAEAARAAAAATAAAVANANANPTPQNSMQATAAQLAQQTADHAATSAQSAADTANGESSAASKLLKLGGLALTLWSFSR